MRLLVAQSDLKLDELCGRLGVPKRSFQRYLSDKAAPNEWAPYPVQFTLEKIAAQRARVVGRRGRTRATPQG